MTPGKRVIVKKKVEILSLDGGGIRGVIPATIVKYAEEYLRKKVPGTTISDHFDFIAGTSTGGGNFEYNNLMRVDRWILLNWAKTIPNIMLDGSADTVSFQMNTIFKGLRSDDSRYYMRINVPRNAQNYNPDFADVSPDNIKTLLKSGKETLEFAKSKGLDEFLDSLLDVS